MLVFLHVELLDWAELMEVEFEWPEVVEFDDAVPVAGVVRAADPATEEASMVGRVGASDMESGIEVGETDVKAELSVALEAGSGVGEGAVAAGQRFRHRLGNQECLTNILPLFLAMCLLKPLKPREGGTA